MIREVREIEQSRTWQNTGKQISNKKKQQHTQDSWIVLVLGDKQSGKSSFLKVIRNDFDPQTKPNSLIQFTHTKLALFGKDACKLQCYQIGNRGLINFMKRFKSQQRRVICVVCLDSSKGYSLVKTASWYLHKIRQVFGSGQHPALRQTRTQSPDAQLILASPVIATLVACKFDLLEKQDNQSKKWVGRSFRYLAHTHSCSLLSSSSKNNQLGLTIRSAFSDFVLGSEGNSKSSKESSKPLFVRFGEDRTDQMNLPSSGSMSGLQVLEKQLQSVCLKEDSKQEREFGEQYKGEGVLQQLLKNRRKALVGIVKGKDKEDEQVDQV